MLVSEIYLEEYEKPKLCYIFAYAMYQVNIVSYTLISILKLMRGRGHYLSCQSSARIFHLKNGNRRELNL